MTSSANNTIKPRDSKYNPLNIIKRCQIENRPVLIAGPMVRYSKLPFRELVRDYNADIVYSPMILAREFVRNRNARMSDFSTNEKDKCLILQIGSNNVVDLMRMVEMVRPYVDGIGLNCGCPIKEQVREGIGAALMSNKELVSDMVRAVKEKYGDSITIETKIRVHNDINETIEFVQCVEKAGVDFITVHGRTKTTRSSQPCDYDKIKIIKQSVNVPVIANGDCKSLDDAYKIQKLTGCDGVMAVRGILNNPAMFAGFKVTPWGCVEKFWNLSTSYGLPFRLIQHHLSCMLDGLINKKLHIELNSTTNLIELIEWFDFNFIVKRPGELGFGESVAVQYRQHRETSARI
ncbi:hypothetical protein CANARDRAFT_29196 [[Candida] arabinofermentans NRRL YB-2248]|uniref:tRNA-dihydrouridine synthase n=1 Tax=[Candida] arabinofermentans NRRL YB-2248 TaxID=983967 RepID=A0A1E4SXU7_9ASCO|nr:hypothetical protein CANARDRAFT_29196 [[Candida] arabinofermentans NRRL YB-2248]